MMGKENILIFLLFLIFCSCQEQQRLLDDALERAGDNRQELEKVLVHYRDSGLKYEAACYLIRNMPYYYSYRGSELDSAKAALAGSLETSDYVLPAEVVRRWNSFDYRRLEKVYDIDVMTANFLIQHIDHVFKVWEGCPWSVDYSFEDFCEWVLPYRIGDEPLELWSTEYYRLFSDSVASLYEGGGMRGWINAASDAINAWFAYNAEFRLPHLGADYLLHYRTGTCRERNDFMVYLLRSLGIPVTIDKYLYSPSNQHSHTWNAVRDSIGGLIPVWNVFRLTDTDGRKKGKVYRLCFARRSEKDTWVDVTHEYFGHNEFHIDVDSRIDAEQYILGLFAPSGYIPLDIVRKARGKAVVKDIEPEVIFQLLCMDKGEQAFAGYPFWVKNGEPEYFIPDTLHRIRGRLLRKYPLRKYLYEYMDAMTGVRVEADNDLRFLNPVTLCKVDVSPTSTYNYFYPQTEGKFRYVRILSPEGKRLDLAGIECFQDLDSETPLPCAVAESDRSRNDDPRVSADKLIDHDELTFCMSHDTDAQVTLDFRQSVPIRKVMLVPHTDDNFIRRGDWYELFYNDGIRGWRSLEKKQAVSGELFFDDIPSGALLWLRDLTRGREEQIFWLENGEQVFVGYE